MCSLLHLNILAEYYFFLYDEKERFWALRPERTPLHLHIIMLYIPSLSILSWKADTSLSLSSLSIHTLPRSDYAFNQTGQIKERFSSYPYKGWGCSEGWEWSNWGAARHPVKPPKFYQKLDCPKMILKWLQQIFLNLEILFWSVD